MKKIILFSSLFILSFIAFSQGTSTEAVEMADKFRLDGKIYVVVAVAIVILIGIFTYIVMLDRKISKLEKEIKIK